MSDKQSRRDVLRTGAAAGSLAVMGGLAGCSSIPFVGGGGGGSYTQWLYAPGAIGSGDHYFFNYRNDKTIRNNEDNFDSSFYDRQESSENSWPLSQMGVDYDSVNSRLSLGTGGVVSGSFKKDDVTGELEDNDFEEDDDYSGYTIYQKNDQRAVGVKNNQAVHVQPGFGGDVDVVSAVETIIDTSKGEEDRYQAESDDMSAILNRVGGGSIVFGGTQEEVDQTSTENGRFEGQVGTGVNASFNGSTTNLKYVILYADSGDIDTGDVEDWTENASSFENVENVNVSKNGRSVVVTAQMDTDEYGTTGSGS